MWLISDLIKSIFLLPVEMCLMCNYQSSIPNHLMFYTREIDILFPGYTHTQRAQPIRWSHWILRCSSVERFYLQCSYDLTHINFIWLPGIHSFKWIFRVYYFCFTVMQWRWAETSSGWRKSENVLMWCL